MDMEALLTSPLGSVPLRDGVLTIGRSPNNGLFINHATVSRHHAEVRPGGPGYWIVDLGSTSGTFVNGERLVSQTPRLLHAGDALQVGSIPLVYEEQRPVSSPASPLSRPVAGSSAPNWPLPGAVARPGSGADHLPVHNGGFVVPDILALSPVSDGLLHATEVPAAYQVERSHEVASSGSAPDFSLETAPLEKFAHTERDASVPVSPSSAVSQVRPMNLAEKQLQFTAFYPRVVPVETWHTLLVYAHLEEALAAVREDALSSKKLLEADPSRTPPLLAEGTQITVVPVFQGVTFQPERISFTWTSAWHPATFRFSSDLRWAGATGAGEIILLAGPLIIASLRILLRFAELGTQPEPDREGISVARYQNIFTSYSPDDSAIVQALRRAYEALGDKSFLDIEVLRAGQNWQNALPRAIESADVFQLFWSPNAAQSQYVYQECQYALQHDKYAGFMRPVYWEKPLEFSPPELAHLHFTYYEFPRADNTRV